MAYLQKVANGGLSVESHAAMLVEHCVRNGINAASDRYRADMEPVDEKVPKSIELHLGTNDWKSHRRLFVYGMNL